MAEIIPLVPRIPNAPTAAEVVARLPTDALKRAWDSPTLDCNDYAIEAIHAEMNKRGRGDYVAV